MKKYLNVEEAAAHVGVSKSTLYVRWKAGDGPPFVKRGGRIFISVELIDEWARPKDELADVKARS